METVFSDSQLEEDIQAWLACACDEHPEFIILLNGVKNGIATIEIDERLYKLQIDQSFGVPVSIGSNQATSSAKI